MMTILNLFTFNYSISVSDIMAVLTFLTVIIGGIFALHKWNMNIKLKRADYIYSLLKDLRTNERNAFYLFEYDEEWHNLQFHKGGDVEKKVDYTLSFFSYICYLKQQNILSNKEFDCFRYELERVLTNEQFKSYFYNIYHFSTKLNKPISFLHLFTYAKDNGYFDDEFWSNTSTRYPQYLNF